MNSQFFNRNEHPSVKLAGPMSHNNINEGFNVALQMIFGMKMTNLSEYRHLGKRILMLILSFNKDATITILFKKKLNTNM